jgi:hypothetical protein
MTDIIPIPLPQIQRDGDPGQPAVPVIATHTEHRHARAREAGDHGRAVF